MRALALIILVTACATAAPIVVQTDRPLSGREVASIRREVSETLPPDCEATSLAVKGDQASFNYACMKR